MRGCGVLGEKSPPFPPAAWLPPQGLAARGAGSPASASPCPLCVFNFRHDDQSAAYPVSISAANAGNDETSCPGGAFPFSTGTLSAVPPPAKQKRPCPLGCQGGQRCGGKKAGERCLCRSRCASSLSWYLRRGRLAGRPHSSLQKELETLLHPFMSLFVWVGTELIFSSFVSGRTALPHDGNMEASTAKPAMVLAPYIIHVNFLISSFSCSWLILKHFGKLMYFQP